MATADVDIANSALAKLGAPAIVALTDNVRAAVLCNARYAALRKKLISSHPWNFATHRVELALTANTPEYEFDSEFLLPSDVLRVLETDLPDLDPWKVEFNVDNNRVLVCNSSSVKIKYLKDITDPTKFPAYFEEALAWLLAADISYAITQSIAVSQNIHAKAQAELRDARGLDAQESGHEEFSTDPWIDVRY